MLDLGIIIKYSDVIN